MSEVTVAVSTELALTTGEQELVRIAYQVEAVEQLPMMHKPVEGEIQRRDFWAGGVYAREMRLAQGNFLTGKMHKYDQINVLTEGDVSVYTENGTLRLQAPYVLVAKAGSKRLFYSHTEVVWLTFLKTSLEDVDEIERTFTCDSVQEFLDFKLAQQKEV